MAVEKRDGVWFNSEVPGETFGSRDAARDAGKGVRQDAAEATYAENLAATEALDAAEDTDADALVAEVGAEFPEAEGFATEVEELETRVTRETEKDVRKRENFLYMATHTEGPAQRYWLTKVAENGWGSYLADDFVS